LRRVSKRAPTMPGSDFRLLSSPSAMLGRFNWIVARRTSSSPGATGRLPVARQLLGDMTWTPCWRSRAARSQFSIATARGR
jgi:hypothetical protein